MSSEILTRFLWAVLIILLGTGFYWLANWVIIVRAKGKVLGLESFRPGVPGILYFTTPTCMPCKTVQRPAIQSLREYLGDDLQVIEVNAMERTDLADYWGVLSVPTTFIIDSKGQPRRVNHGVTRADKLMEQIEEVGRDENAISRILQKTVEVWTRS